MMTPAAIIKFFLEAIKASEGAFEQNQARAVLRALRAIYFYPDDIICELDKIIQNGGIDVSPLLHIKDMLDKSEETINKEIDFLTSPGITTNLSIPSKVIINLREATSLKRDIRGKLVSMFFTHQLPANYARVREIAEETKSEINKLNSMITKIERQILK